MTTMPIKGDIRIVVERRDSEWHWWVQEYHYPLWERVWIARKWSNGTAFTEARALKKARKAAAKYCVQQAKQKQAEADRLASQRIEKVTCDGI